MPAPVQDVLTENRSELIDFGLEPAFNAVHSLFLLTMTEERSGLGDWVVRTAQALSPEERQRHRLVMVGFYFLVNPYRSWPSFPAFVEHLAQEDATAMRDRLLATYASLGKGDAQGLDAEEVLASADNYLAFLRGRFEDKFLEEDLERQAYEYVVNPEKLQDLIVSHLRFMWREHLEAEWRRVRPMLEDSVRAFQQVDFEGMSPEQAIELVTGEKAEGHFWDWTLKQERRLVFLPSAHVGPYVGRYHSDEVLWLVFGARLPDGVDVDAPDLSRADIVVRLNALADDDRLRVLKLISERGELRSQEVMEALDFSQSASSRHLKQLSASGFLTERRCNGAKCYQLNPPRIEYTLDAVAKFLLADAR